MSIKAGYVFKEYTSDQYIFWDEFVKLHPHGTLFHSTSWLKSIKGKLAVYVVERDSQIVGGYAGLFYVKNRQKGFHIPPLTPYSGPLVGRSWEKKSVQEEHDILIFLLEQLPHSPHWDFLYGVEGQFIHPFHWKGFSSSLAVSYVIEKSYDEWLAGMNKNKIREYKKLEEAVNKGSLKVILNGPVAPILDLNQVTAQRNGFSFDRQTLEALFTKSENLSIRTMLIESEEYGPLSGSIMIYDDQAVYNLINGSIRVEHPVYKTINLYALWDGIHFALTTGRKFDFEGSMLKGVESFYRLMGGEYHYKMRFQKTASLPYLFARLFLQFRGERKPMK